MKPTIQTEGLTKDYGKGRGVFGLDFAVQPGEVFGFLGPNGAGKTTTIRQLMGFVRPDSGSARILGLDCFSQAPAIQAQTGYLPGELALPEDLTGEGFIRFVAAMRGQKDLSRARELCDRFQLDGRQRLRRMSKGTKQKMALVCAFMARPAVLLLDEPTSGLDPLMQNRFVELVLEEKARGATVFLSSHQFEEVERTCDRVAVLRRGRLAAIEPVERLRSARSRRYTFTFAQPRQAADFAAGWQGAAVEDTKVTVQLQGADRLPALLQSAAQNQVTGLETAGQSLEEMFLKLYGEENAG